MMTQYLRRPAVSQRYGVPASTLYDWIGKGQFPRGEQLGPGVVAVAGRVPGRGVGAVGKSPAEATAASLA